MQTKLFPLGKYWWIFKFSLFIVILEMFNLKCIYCWQIVKINIFIKLHCIVKFSSDNTIIDFSLVSGCLIQKHMQLEMTIMGRIKNRTNMRIYLSCGVRLPALRKSPDHSSTHNTVQNGYLFTCSIAELLLYAFMFTQFNTRLLLWFDDEIVDNDISN